LTSFGFWGIFSPIVQKERDFSQQSYGKRTPEIRQPLILRPQTEPPSFPQQQELGETRILQMLSKIPKEDQVQKQEGQSLPKRNKAFEPFINDEDDDQQGCRFINLYGGNFAKDMQLNKHAVEQVAKIASLDGQIILTSLSPNRQRSIDANSDGSVTSKKRLFWEETVEKEEGNPAFLVTSIPQGWKIEINDQKLTERLAERKSGKNLRQVFVARFNSLLRQAIFECVRREKLTGEKDDNFYTKLFLSVLSAGIPSLFFLGGGDGSNAAWLPIDIGFLYGFWNVIAHRIPLRGGLHRKIDNFYELVMPLVEVDKVLRSFAYLSIKGRQLVKLQNQPA
jgi:hypothetical protein